MKRLNRRRFLQTSALGAAALGLPTTSYAKLVGANESIRMGVIGVGGRGGDHIKGFSNMPGVRLVALSDCDSKILGSAVAKCKDLGHEVQPYADLRKLLEDKDIDAVSTATPNHWHSLVTVWGCQAGKDVYCEKPVSHNVWEGRKAVEAARKHQRIVQTGTQSRSSRAGVAEAIAWIQKGNLGALKLVRAICYKRRESIGKVDGPQPIPPDVDYDLWCGPAPKDPLMRKRLHYDWYWVWATGNGDLGNQGIHQMDIARWIIGAKELSSRVWSVGGRFGYIDDGQTANTQIVFHDFSPAPLIFEVRGLPEKNGAGGMDEYQFRGNKLGCPVGVVAQCEGGQLFVPGYAATGAVAFDNDGKEAKRWSGTEDHFANFIKAVRSRKTEDLNADILEGHLSSALCHTGNISYRLGAASSPAEIRERIKADRDAEATFDRMVQHLEANDVRLDDIPAILGPVLKMDPQSERFVENEAANELLDRKYREPFAVPASV